VASNWWPFLFFFFKRFTQVWFFFFLFWSSCFFSFIIEHLLDFRLGFLINLGLEDSLRFACFFVFFLSSCIFGFILQHLLDFRLGSVGFFICFLLDFFCTNIENDLDHLALQHWIVWWLNFIVLFNLFLLRLSWFSKKVCCCQFFYQFIFYSYYLIGQSY
jgi:hypothetical protein